MATMTRPRLSTVSPESGYRLTLKFIHGGACVVDLREDVHRLPGLRPLRDLAVFATVQVSDGGWSAEWPAHDIQIGADTLWWEARHETA
jgi:hypothetical protein